jgi:hypothetical protein
MLMVMTTNAYNADSELTFCYNSVLSMSVGNSRQYMADKHKFMSLTFNILTLVRHGSLDEISK